MTAPGHELGDHELDHAPSQPEPAPPRPVLPEPVLPEQSREDTDAGWGEYPESSDERLYRDRPPHWADY